MLALTVQYWNIENDARIILHASGDCAQGNNKWRLLGDGRIVLQEATEYALTVIHDRIEDDAEIILHTSGGNAQRNNRWSRRADGRILLSEVDMPFGLTVRHDNLEENQPIILHTSGGNAQRNNTWTLLDDGRIVIGDGGRTRRVKAVVSLPGGRDYQANRDTLSRLGFLTPVVFFPEAESPTDPQHPMAQVHYSRDPRELCWQCQWIANLRVLEERHGSEIEFIAVDGGGVGCAWERHCLVRLYPRNFTVLEDRPAP